MAACSRFIGVLSEITTDEVVEISALERIFFEGEMFVSAKVVNPERVRPRFLGGGFAGEEADVGLDALGVKDAGGKTEQGVNVGLLE